MRESAMKLLNLADQIDNLEKQQMKDIANNHQPALSQPPHATNPTTPNPTTPSPTPSNQHASSQSLHMSTIADTLRNNDGQYDDGGSLYNGGQ
jgi:hypothetical protein